MTTSRNGFGRRSSLTRRGPTRSGNLVLVVCEGRKTEQNYFRSTKNRWKIGRLTIAAANESTAPINIVEKAVARRDEFKERKRIEFDQVWCVFDHDEHETFDKALTEAAKNNIQVAFSIPCFEFWYLLHFEYTTRPFRDFSEVARQLKKHLASYNKDTDYTEQLFPRMEEAIANALKVRDDLKKTGAERPITNVDRLMNILVYDPIQRK